MEQMVVVQKCVCVGWGGGGGGGGGGVVSDLCKHGLAADTEQFYTISQYKPMGF